MTTNNWSKWFVGDFTSDPQTRPKLLPGFDRLDDRLRAVLLEQDLQTNLLKRKQAGGGQKQRKRQKPKRVVKQAPRVCDFQEVYAEKRKELKRLARSQRNEFHFRSTPVPNFERSHQRLERRKIYLNSLQKVTKPRCPGTLATSMEALQKRNKEQGQRHKVSGFTPRINPGSSMDYLHRQPFIPRVESTCTHPKPFRLHTSERALRRRLYDERKRMRMDLQMELQANDWFKRERSELRKLRQMTNFKATPSPWKRKKGSSAGVS
ncbi:targeting protein for Xklp2-B [Drosophila biarmipes]|uniref:targeting protein for Xklp2-B n=1 Tax=Drosophila biarmipes TaxID=125945 RepID=UPI0007E76124|nr:targeting protein for Xklp2-B [Drosophila biarmipes]